MSELKMTWLAPTFGGTGSIGGESHHTDRQEIFRKMALLVRDTPDISISVRNEDGREICWYNERERRRDKR